VNLPDSEAYKMAKDKPQSFTNTRIHLARRMRSAIMQAELAVLAAQPGHNNAHH
jgi:hypothetical protein